MSRRKPKGTQANLPMNAKAPEPPRKLKQAVNYVPPEIGSRTPSFRPEGQKGNYIIQVFWNVDMRCNHVGLGLIAKEYGEVDIREMVPGEMCVFVNVAKTKLKTITGCSQRNSMGVMSYYQSPSGKLDTHAIDYIPESFSAKGKIDYSQALKASLEERLGRKRTAPVKQKPSDLPKELL